MRRIFTAALLGTVLFASPAIAAGADPTTPALTISDRVVAAAAATPAADTNFSTNFTERLRRPAALPALYAVSAGLQGYDAISTYHALRAGGREANPLMRGVTKSPSAFVAVKAGVTTFSILAAERMWRDGHRMGAIGVMLASNLTMSMVAANNARVSASLK